MSQRIVVTGTGTGIGKTVFSAGLANLLGANYWKPIQILRSSHDWVVCRPIASCPSATA